MDKSRPFGFTTTILHSDRQKNIEHGSLHKPIHTAVAYGYKDARELAERPEQRNLLPHQGESGSAGMQLARAIRGMKAREQQCRLDRTIDIGPIKINEGNSVPPVERAHHTDFARTDRACAVEPHRCTWFIMLAHREFYGPEPVPDHDWPSSLVQSCLFLQHCLAPGRSAVWR